MQTDRRDILSLSAGGALAMTLAGQAGAQPGTPIKPALAGTLVMLAELTVRPDRLEAFFDYTVANLKVSRAAPGNLAFEMLVDEARPGKVLFYEVWASPKAQQEYMAWRVQAGDLTKLMGFLAGEPRFTALRSVAG